MGMLVQLQSMIGICYIVGVCVYVDIVVNQMVDGSGMVIDGLIWNVVLLVYFYFSVNDFYVNCSIVDSDYNLFVGCSNVQNCCFGGLFDFVIESSYVQGQIVNYLKVLLVLGVDGFCIDVVKYMFVSVWMFIMSVVKVVYLMMLQGELIWVMQEIINDGEVDCLSYFLVGIFNEFQFMLVMCDVFCGNNGFILFSIFGIMGIWGNWGGSWGFIQLQNVIVFIINWDIE